MKFYAKFPEAKTGEHMPGGMRISLIKKACIVCRVPTYWVNGFFMAYFCSDECVLASCKEYAEIESVQEYMRKLDAE